MQAVLVPWRSAFAAAAAVAIASWVVAPPLTTTEPVPPATVTTLDDWPAAQRLARVIEERRYGEIDAAAAAIDPSSPHARWVPAAIGLAIEQIDETSAAYVRMEMCDELGKFLHELKTEWPLGFASRKHVSCDRWVCGTGRAEAIKEAGGVDNYRRLERERHAWGHAEEVSRLEFALILDDHVAALAACSAMKLHGEFDARCLAEACRAKELAIAEVVHWRIEHVHRLGGELWRTDEPGYIARVECEAAGVTFDGYGRASALDVRSPSQLVHVHPDAPIARDGIIIDW